MVSIVTKGGISYDSMKRMSALELRQIHNTINRYLAEREKAMGGKKKIGGGQIS
tara:strand:+ start:3177 stop:3338 length:162 start_codon:yes stop_codon:yes gene_type:complete